MMRHTKILVLFMTVLAVGVLFIGCSSKKSGGKETITFLTMDAVNFRGRLEEFIREFNAANPQYEVVPTFSADIGQSFTTTMQSGKPSDITFIYSNAVVTYVGTNKVAQVPADFLSKHRRRMFDYVFEPVLFEGGVYGVPYNFFPSWGQIMYVDDHWKEAGVDPKSAKNWDEFMQLCQKVVKRDNAGKMIQAGFSAQRDEETYFINRMLQLGGIPFNSDGSAAFDNEIGRQALQNFVDVFKKYRVDEVEFGETIDSFRRGSVASTNGMPWFAAMLVKDTPDLHFSFMDTPRINENPNYWAFFQTWAHIVSKPAGEKAGVWAFLDYLLETDNMARWAEFAGEMPPVIEALEDPRVKDDPILSHFVDLMPYGVSKDIPQWLREEVLIAIRNMCQSVALGQVSLEEGLRQGAAEVTRLNRQR
jgi:multiple sugar transport system substrate-binding protein